MAVLEEVKLESWVGAARSERDREFRQAIHTILCAIAAQANLQATMVLKGGILLAVRYQSNRYTTDIDLSTDKTLADLNIDEIMTSLNNGLTQIAEGFDYGLDCRIQSHEIEPSSDASFPCFKMRIGYAYKGTSKHKRLIAGQSPTVISIDYSLNEPLPNIENFDVAADKPLKVYSLLDLIAEKYRALLQQPSRDRFRRQDVFDLYLILEKFAVLEADDLKQLHVSLMRKSEARRIYPDRDSIAERDIVDRARRDYGTLVDEVEGSIPDFDMAFK